MIIPITLSMDEDVPGEGLAVFTVMKSFGKRAQASLQAYADRLSSKANPWSIERVQTWQKVLVTTGWMTLLQEGKPPAPGEATGVPRLWWLNWTKNEQPPLGAFMRPGPRGGVIPPLGKSQPRDKTPPKQGLSSNSRVSSSKHPLQDEAWAGMQAIWSQRFIGQTLTWPNPKDPAGAIAGFQVKLCALIDRLGVAELLKRWGHLVNDGFNRPSLRVFMADPDKFIEPRNNGGGKGRPVTDIRDL